MEDRLIHNPKFENLNKEENAELRFFCEALSLIDAVNFSNILFSFASRVQESKDGTLNWAETGLFEKGEKSPNYLNGVKRVRQMVDEVVRKGWITPLRVRSLRDMALEACEYHQNQKEENNESNLKRSSNVAKTWKDVANQMNELANYQDEFMSYHADFQKENYLPHPDSWKVYFATFSFLFIALFCNIFLNLTSA